MISNCITVYHFFLYTHTHTHTHIYTVVILRIILSYLFCYAIYIRRSTFNALWIIAWLLRAIQRQEGDRIDHRASVAIASRDSCSFIDLELNREYKNALRLIMWLSTTTYKQGDSKAARHAFQRLHYVDRFFTGAFPRHMRGTLRIRERSLGRVRNNFTPITYAPPRRCSPARKILYR